MQQIIRSPQSKIDLWQIVDYISAEDLDAALGFLDKIDATLMNVLRCLGIGTARDDLLPGLRSIAVGNYLMFFRKVERGIELVRVFHGARDCAKEF